MDTISLLCSADESSIGEDFVERIFDQLSSGALGWSRRQLHMICNCDVLIVNQGVFIGKELEKQSAEEVKFMIDVNLVGSFNVIKAFPAMKAREGRGPASISLVSSQAGQLLALDDTFMEETSNMFIFDRHKDSGHK